MYALSIKIYYLYKETFKPRQINVLFQLENVKYDEEYINQVLLYVQIRLLVISIIHVLTIGQKTPVKLILSGRVQ